MLDRLGVIFDMDGVIIDSEPIYKSQNLKIFKRLGIEVDEHFQLEYVGVTKWRKWELLKETFNLPESIEKLIEIQNTIFHHVDWEYKKLLYPAVIPLLKELQKREIPIALASSSERTRVKQVLEECGLTGYFKEVIAGDEVKNGKPDPEIFLTAAKQLHLEPENCVVIEDSYNGLIAAKSVNMFAIGVKHQDYPIDLSIADMVISSLSEIELDLILQSLSF